MSILIKISIASPYGVGFDMGIDPTEPKYGNSTYGKTGYTGLTYAGSVLYFN